MSYTFTNSWFEYSEIKKLIFSYADTTKINKILEIGSYEGASSCYFSDFLLNNIDSELTCVDPFDINDKTSPLDNNTKNLFMNNISKSKNYNKIIFEEMYGTDFYKKNTKKYNLIYIDGSHLLDDITIDFNNCLNIIEMNGIIWMDDYRGGDGIIIKNHIDKLYEENKNCLKIIHMGYQIAFQKYN
jgi:predicted O-methyltransferase YrrM